MRRFSNKYIVVNTPHVTPPVELVPSSELQT
jgi:hypothetical protein